MTTDLRRPAEVTRDFRERLARELVDRGFRAQKQKGRFVRRLHLRSWWLGQPDRAAAK